MATHSQVQPVIGTLSRTTALRFVAGVALSALSGILLLLAFPPYGVWLFMWVALVPFLYAQYRVLPPRYARLAPAINNGVWLWPMLMRIFAGGPWFIVHLGLFIAVLALLLNTERKFHDLTRLRWFVPYGVLAWVGFEMVRSFIPILGTMGFVANTQAAQAWLIQPVSVFSIYGLGLMILLVNFALAQALFAALDRKWLPPDAVPVDAHASRRWLAGVGIGLAAWIILSLVILGGAPQGAPVVRAGILQPGFPEPAHVDPDTPQEVRVQVLLDLGREAARQGANVLFTPEMGIAIDPQVEYTQEFTSLAAGTGAYIFLTYGLDTQAGFRNEAVLLAPNGQFQAVYGKIHPSLGEPRAIYTGVYPVYNTPVGRLATAICHDGNFTDVTRRLARNGAQLIAIPSRETRGISEHTWTHHVFRAIETRTAIVHSDVAWSSAIIDPYGRILEIKMPLESTRTTLVHDVPLGSGKTLVNVLGDWLGWVSLAGWVAFMVFVSRTERRAKAAHQKA